MYNKVRIISLGYNCEISFRLKDYFDELDAYIFSWSYEIDRHLFLDALKNISDIFSGEVSLCDDHMFKCDKYGIKFHPRYNILPKTGDVTQAQIEEALNELKERISHLKDKTMKMFLDDEKKVFFVKIENFGAEKISKYIDELSIVINSITNGKYILVVILEKTAVTSEIFAKENEYIKIRILKKFSHIKHTDVSGDIIGWYKIIKEFSGYKSSTYWKNWCCSMKRKLIGSIIKRIKFLKFN